MPGSVRTLVRYHHDGFANLTGGDPLQVHHLPRDPEFLLELPERVQVLEVTDAT